MVNLLYLFGICLGLLVYNYLGYGILATFVGLFKRRSSEKQFHQQVSLTVIIPAYNELQVLSSKMENCLKALAPFPAAQIILITDGSDDGSDSFQFSYPGFLHLHNTQRLGKSEAINRAVQHAAGDIVVITDANAMVNEEAFTALLNRFKRKKVGAVSGEKKVMGASGVTASEGVYWKYESWIKNASAQMYSLTGAAGELLAFRKSLFQPIPSDAILDDLVLSLSIIRQGYVIDYEPEAYATEPPSKSIDDEFGRKIRISAGVWQTLLRNVYVFNPFTQPIFKFQFFSHRLMRWILSPLCIVVVFVANAFLLDNGFFTILFGMQLVFYFAVLVGYIFRNHNKLPQVIFIPFYFIMMNVAIIVGAFRFIGGKESVLWKKASR